MKLEKSNKMRQKLLIFCATFAIIAIALSYTSTCCGTNVARATSDGGFTWGEAEAHQALQIGWGCPLEGPISNITSGPGGRLLGYINWIIPFGEMAAIMTGWLLSIGAYYLASILLRWKKVIS